MEFPPKDDIRLLHNYLCRQRNHVLVEIKNEFSIPAWLKHAEFILVSVLLFNRRRAGEVKRILIEDF